MILESYKFRILESEENGLNPKTADRSYSQILITTGTKAVKEGTDQKRRRENLGPILKRESMREEEKALFSPFNNKKGFRVVLRDKNTGHTHQVQWVVKIRLTVRSSLVRA